MSLFILKHLNHYSTSSSDSFELPSSLSSSVFSSAFLKFFDSERITPTNTENPPANHRIYIGFRYFVTNGGPTGANSNIIGLDTFSVDRPLSSDSFFKNNFSFYPNPVNNVLNISVKNEMTINNLSITDLNGRVVSSSSSVINSIDVSDLSSGVYLISIETNEGKGTAKFVKN